MTRRLALAGPLPPAQAAPAAPQLIQSAAPSSWREIEKQAIIDALHRCAGNQTRAAELLGMPRRTFCAKVKEYGIPRPRS
jgi:DNA-binding NtrC family response regulator